MVEGSGSTDGRWGSRSRALLGRREAGDGGSTVMWCSAAAMAGAGGVPGQGRGGAALGEGGEWSGDARTAPGQGNKRGGSSAGEERGVKARRRPGSLVAMAASRSASARVWHSGAGEHSNAARGQRSGRGACWRGRAASSNGAAARRGDDGERVPWRAAGGVRRSWARARRNGSRRGRGVERGCENGSWEGN